MHLTLVHHGDAVGPDVDPSRPLSAIGRAEVEQLASMAARRGVRPDIVWHSGKLRAKETAQAFWRACNALAEFSAARNLQPDDPPEWIREELGTEARAAEHQARDILIAGHFPHLPGLLAALVGAPDPPPGFPLHGLVHLETSDGGETWRECWRLTRSGHHRQP